MKSKISNSTIFRSKASVVTFLLSVTLAIFGNASAHALLISGSNYVASGPLESMTAVFNTPDGGVSANSYSGLVKLVVSGTGQSYFNYLNDAFHVYSPGPAPASDAGYYQLTFSNSTLVANNILQAAANFIAYDLDAGLDVNAPYLPQYRSDHTYNFVLDVGALASTLHFGVSDGVFADNSGAYNITLQQLVRSSVPEPTTLMLFGLGLAAIGYQRRKRVALSSPDPLCREKMFEDPRSGFDRRTKRRGVASQEGD